MESEMRKVIGVLKKRTSDFERHVREFRITEYGLQIGEPLLGLTGILSGNPTWVDLDDRADNQQLSDGRPNGRGESRSPPFRSHHTSRPRHRRDSWDAE
jgi:circadian clock protein KaiC